MTIDQEKVKRELELEWESVEIGVQRYRAHMQKASITELPPGLVLLHKAVTPFAHAIAKFIEPARGGGRLQEARRFLCKLDPYETAYITARVLINAIAETQAVQSVAIQITNQLVDHLEFLKFKEAMPNYVDAIIDSLNHRTTNEHYRRVNILMAKRKAGIPDSPEMTAVEKLHIGIKLIEMFIETTGLVERIQGDNGLWYIQGTREAIKWIDDHNAKCELLSPLWLPMVIPPVPWQGPLGGGYLTGSINRRMKLVKTTNDDVIKLHQKANMPLVYRAVNILQEVPWRINKKVLEVVKDVWRLDNGLANMPRDEEEPLPPTPWSDDEEFERLKETDPAVVKAWKAEAKAVYAQRVRNKSKRFQVAQKIWVAEKFADEPEIYFPWSLDWRGRLYPVPSLVNPQADDLGKALLEFAVGKPLGERGAYWLAIQLANKFGNDKVSFDDRIAWVRDHEAEILDSAEHPIDGRRFWTEADDPWQFLAACFEWAGYKEQGESFESHLPIAMDGSCNGLQNFSAMLRDEVGGKAVNLIPSDKPQDVYMEVVKVVSKLVEEDAAKGNEMAKLWVGKIDRSLAKRNVMTVPYGATKIGMRDQLLDELQKRYAANGVSYLGNVSVEFQACTYLANKMWEAIGQVVIGARKVMDWLQEVARVVASAEKPITWTTPAGYVVHQAYYKESLKRIVTFWGTAKVRITIGLNTQTEKLDKRKQVSGISPNFVHSMDASHLMLTINKAKDAGIDFFACIHDSYGTHACDTDKLNQILRETFIEQYSENVLQKFLDEVKTQIPEKLWTELPPVPDQGTLDLSVVRDSLYFFA